MEARLLIDVLTKLSELYERLHKLASQQHECVEREDTDELLEVLSQRAGVVDQITRLEAALRPTRQDWTAVMSRLGEDHRRAAEQKMSRCRDLLAQITAADNDDALLLQQRKLSVGRQLKAARAGAQVNQRYAAAAYGGAPVRMDLSR